MHKILQGRLQQYVNREIPDVEAEMSKEQLSLEKAEKSEIKLPTPVGS